MADYFLDASAVVKRYATEPGSERILAITEVAAGNLMEQGHSPLTFVAADSDLLSAAQAEGLPIEDPTQRT